MNTQRIPQNKRARYAGYDQATKGKPSKNHPAKQTRKKSTRKTVGHHALSTTNQKHTKWWQRCLHSKKEKGEQSVTVPRRVVKATRNQAYCHREKESWHDVYTK